MHHHEVEMVPVASVDGYLFLHLRKVCFQVNLYVVEPMAKKDRM